MQVANDETKHPIDSGSRGQRSSSTMVKVNYGTLSMIACGRDTGYSFCPITFKLHMQVAYDETRHPIDSGSWGQRSRSTLALCL